MTTKENQQLIDGLNKIAAQIAAGSQGARTQSPQPTPAAPANLPAPATPDLTGIQALGRAIAIEIAAALRGNLDPSSDPARSVEASAAAQKEAGKDLLRLLGMRENLDHVAKYEVATKMIADLEQKLIAQDIDIQASAKRYDRSWQHPNPMTEAEKIFFYEGGLSLLEKSGDRSGCNQIRLIENLREARIRVQGQQQKRV